MVDEEKEGQAPQKSNKGLLFIIIGAVLGLILIGVVLIVLLGGESSQEIEQKPDIKRQPAQNATRDTSLMNIGPIYQVPLPNPFIVNLASQGRDSYLQTSLSIALDNVKLQPEIEKKADIITSVIINVLSSKTPEELKTNKGKKRALEEIVNQINEFLVDGYITNAFFTSFVIQ